MSPGGMKLNSKSEGAILHRASVRIGVVVGLASALVIGMIGLATTMFVVFASRQEGHRGRPPGPRLGPGWRDRVVAVDEVIGVVSALVLLGVLILGLIAWYAARQATKPLAEAMRLQRNFVADASHELRTPLTTLDTRLQVAERRLERGGDVAESLDEARQDAATMAMILNDLLVGAEGAGGILDRTEVCFLQESVDESVRLTSAPAQQRQVTVSAVGPADMTVVGNQVALTRALVILLDNAIAHSPVGGTVTISAKTTKSVVQIRVSDQGGGIAGIDPDQLFRRFTRGTTSSGGAGLGLSLVADIAARFGGRVLVEDTGPQGTTFLLELRSG